MATVGSCPKHACGFWGIPLEKLGHLRNLSDEHFECCLWHESKVKCRRNPLFANDPEAQDFLEPVSTEDWDDMEFDEGTAT